MKTYIPKEKDFDRKTYLVNAEGKTLGRLATRVATVLIGKGKTVFSQDKLSGDQVIVINAKDVHISGNKPKQKLYTYYTGYPAGLRTKTFEKLMETNPEKIITQAISRMLPKNKLGREMLRRLRVYAGKEHKNQAQKPIALEV